jgi:hypothetical protein
MDRWTKGLDFFKEADGSIEKGETGKPGQDQYSSQHGSSRFKQLLVKPCSALLLQGISYCMIDNYFEECYVG